ncbi:SHOCT domain-containing protein [Mycolicibacterium sp. CBM1]
MSTPPQSSEINQHSLLTIAASIVLATALGFLFNAIHAPDSVQGSVLAVAVGLPAAIAYRRQSMHRDRVEDAAQIAEGQLRRPIALVAPLLISALFLAWTAAAYVGVRILRPVLHSGPGGSLFGFAIAWVLCFFIASYASHYIARHAYRWTAAAAAVVSVVLLLSFVADPHVQRAHGAELGLRILLASAAILGFVGSCISGTWHGRRHHAEFLKKKLERIERRTAPGNGRTSHQQIHRLVTGPPSGDATATQPVGEKATAPDDVRLLKRLAELRDDGVLTETEFQQKKAEILGRM